MGGLEIKDELVPGLVVRWDLRCGQCFEAQASVAHVLKHRPVTPKMPDVTCRRYKVT